jgi:hypothetical protein
MAITNATQNQTVASLQATIDSLKTVQAKLQEPASKAPAMHRDGVSIGQKIGRALSPRNVVFGGAGVAAAATIIGGIVSKSPGMVLGGSVLAAAGGALVTYGVVRGAQSLRSGEGRAFVIGTTALGALAGIAAGRAAGPGAANMVGGAIGLAATGLAASGVLNSWYQVANEPDHVRGDMQNWSRLMRNERFSQ